MRAFINVIVVLYFHVLFYFRLLSGEEKTVILNFFQENIADRSKPGIGKVRNFISSSQIDMQGHSETQIQG
jgi:hypothetical protein